MDLVTEPAINLDAATALLLLFVLLHGVLKWLHHPVLKYVML